MSTWDQRFFELVICISSWSEDRSRKVGAVIVGPDNEIRSTGYNGMPRGINSKFEARHSRDDGEKYFWFEHAERNAIYNAARIGVSLNGCRLYVSLFPCSDCARAIIQSGICQINTFEPPANEAVFGRSFEVSRDMFLEAGISVNYFSPFN
jgi:dCMP deaminase